MTRLHPFDFVFGALADERFPEIQAEARQGKRDPADRLQFQQLQAVQRVLADVVGVPKPAVRTRTAQQTTPDFRVPTSHFDVGEGAALEEYGTLLYAMYRFWDGGRHSYPVAIAALDRADQRGVGSSPAVPGGACYVQLPERVFWARIADSAPPEPLDGFFLAAGPSGVELTVLAVLGLRPDREGFSQISVTALAEDFQRARAIVRRPLFAPELEGGDRAGLKSLVSEAELLYLAYLALAEVPR